MAGQLPDDIVQAIAISNAKSIGEQPAILANLALAQQIFNQNMQQQISLSQQQAMNQVQMAAAAKCVAMIETAGGCKNQASIDQMGKDIEKITQEMGKLFKDSGSNPSGGA
ncbi:FAD-binding monooxygenase [Luteibacter aegosomatissinici]|uniref:FAD-binding monooxygenase n=1 Tax=Luteibacter aegosomatissinici TaxID=2911539 RepID=UPI001FFA591B|nr:FAD-binding monooxygenase [Luteibacter aegosomatissinici]UPG95832.1 FAD-binding monooxygenase [Luteibacter aegosomatissinici]